MVSKKPPTWFRDLLGFAAIFLVLTGFFSVAAYTQMTHILGISLEGRGLVVIAMPLGVSFILSVTIALLRRSQRRARESEEVLKASEANLKEEILHRHQVQAELERALISRKEFLATMSHEFRTPLNAILGMADVLKLGAKEILDPKQYRQLQVIEESGRHLLDLIKDILDFSQIEAGRLSLNFEPFDIEDLAEEVIGAVQLQARDKSLGLDLSMTCARPAISADRRRIKQILLNLMINAIKFTPEGGRVELSICCNETQTGVVMSVHDTGIGIAPEDQGRLFEPFVQVDASLSRRAEGTGLGLALSQRLARLHHGDICVESTPGQGSRFSLHLPYEQAA